MTGWLIFWRSKGKIARIITLRLLAVFVAWVLVAHWTQSIFAALAVMLFGVQWVVSALKANYDHLEPR